MFCDATFWQSVSGRPLLVGHCVHRRTREVLGTAVGDSESYEFWREFLALTRARGLTGASISPMPMLG